MYGLSESRKVSDAQRRHCRGYSKFTPPYREPNGSLLGFLNGTKTHCIRNTQHIHTDSISSNGYMRGILPNHTDFNCYVYASHASDVNTRKSITGHIRFMISGDLVSGKAEYKHLLLYKVWRRNPWLQVQRHKKPSDKLEYLSKWVCVSIFHNNDYGSSRRSSHTKHSDTRKEFARYAFNKGTIEELVLVPTAEQLADG